MRYRIEEHLYRCSLFIISLLASGLLLTLLLAWPSCTAAQVRGATLLEVKGAIGPAISDYLQNGLKKSEKLGAAVVIIRLDTPGGLDHSMRDIIRAILASPIPVITYVAPDGARAASAGTYILYASHVAAMAPATNLGAATPVRVGGAPSDPGKNEEKKDRQQKDDMPADAMERKIINDASAYIKALADRHGRNSDWAVKAVRESVSLSAGEALAIDVIDIVATDLADLLSQADGREVRMDSGVKRLDTRDLTVTPIEQTWRTKLLSVVTDPNIAYLLVLLGIFGLMYELGNPGLFLPGVAGSISLLLALYAFQVLPVNYSGLALILLGILLMIGEAFMPSFGILGFGGIIAFVIGSIILMDDEELRISLPIIVATTAASAMLLIFIIGRFLMLRKKSVGTGAEAMIGMTGEAIDDFTGEGRIWLSGESWLAQCKDKVIKGEKVKVTAKDGLSLTVEKLKEDM
ncbi:MAG: serine protease [Desulfobulbaceae bacterium BRH_c16a]|nr:MAG: serine protease [Desulfobulbaceae bacterium BRH_c16a]